MGDRDLMTPRWRSAHVKVVAAREGERLIGSNVATRWGSFGFFGPLTVLPEYWDRGVAQKLLAATMTIFDRWGVRHTGSVHVPAQCQACGLVPEIRLLAALSYGGHDAHAGSWAHRRARAAVGVSPGAGANRLFTPARKLTNKIDKGLDLTGEIRAVLAQRTGDVVLTYTRGTLDAFAICLNGPGSEGGGKTCYVKFGAARGGAGAGGRFDKLLEACEAFAASRGATYRGRREPGSRRCVPAHARPRISSDHARRGDAASTCGGIQSGRCVRDRRLALRSLAEPACQASCGELLFGSEDELSPASPCKPNDSAQEPDGRAENAGSVVGAREIMRPVSRLRLQL